MPWLLRMQMRNKSVLIILVILASGLIGTGLSALYTQKGYTFTVMTSTLKVSYGFPLGWYGYSQTYGEFITFIPPPRIYWFLLESFLLDFALYFAVSFFVTFATIKSVKMARKTRTSENLSVSAERNQTLFDVSQRAVAKLERPD